MPRRAVARIFSGGAGAPAARWRGWAARAAMRTRFGEFVLDDEEKQLLRSGSPVHLTPKAYGLLRFLVQQGHRAVSKPEILEHLWPSTFVSEAALTSVVKELRRALRDQAGAPRFIRGVRGFGYAFCGDTAVLEEPAGGPAPGPGAEGCEFRVLWQHRELILSPGENVLGRTHEAGVWVEDASVSRRHAVIRISGRSATIEDCGSKNGTVVRGERIQGPVELRPGESFWLGSACLALACYDGGVSTASAQLVPLPEPGD